MGLLDPITGAPMGVSGQSGVPSGDGGMLPATDTGSDLGYNPGYAIPDNAISNDSGHGSSLYSDGASTGSIPQGYNVQHAEAPVAIPVPQAYVPDEVVWGIQARDAYIKQLEGWAEQFRPLEIALQQNPHLQDVILRELTGQQQQQQDPGAPPPASQMQSGPPPAQRQQSIQGDSRGQNPSMPPAVAAKMASDMHQMQVSMHEIQAAQKLKDMQQMYGPTFNPNELLNYSLATGILDLDEAWTHMVGQRSLQYWQQQQQAMRQYPQAPQGQVYANPQSQQQRSNVPAAPRVQPPSARASAPAVPVARPRDWAEATEQAIRMLGAR